MEFTRLLLVLCCNSLLLVSIASVIERDGNLDGLIGVLKSQETVDAFKSMSNNSGLNNPERAVTEKYDKLIDSLTPWVIGEPSRPLVSPRPHPDVLNCSAPQYVQAFSGMHGVNRNYIVDFVPFGYDIDKLELRLLEGYPFVDLFVVYEAPLTHTGRPKPMYFDLVRNTTRFTPFKDKILYVYSTIDDLREKVPSPGSPRSKFWKLERAMRYEIIRLFKEWLWSEYLKLPGEGGEPVPGVGKNTTVGLTLDQWATISALVFVESDMQSVHKHDLQHVEVMGVQNDADEFMIGKTLQHLQRCELKSSIQYPLYAPAFAFKKNFHWLQVGGGVGDTCLEGTAGQTNLLRFLWTAGPRLWPLQAMLVNKNTMRHRGRPVAGDKHRYVHCKNHLGLGAAIHMTAVNEPVEEWLKTLSVVDTFNPEGKNLLGRTMRSAIDGLGPTLDAEFLFKEAVHPWCGHGAKHQRENKNMAMAKAGMEPPKGSNPANKLSQVEADLVFSTLPWAVRLNPDRYPFMYPGESKVAGPFAAAATQEWANQCV